MEYSIHEPDIWSFNSDGAEGAENLRIYIDKAAYALLMKMKNTEEE